MKSVTKAAARFKLPESQKLEERHVVGRDVYGGKHAYGVEFFDRDGNGRADAARVTGEVTRPGFNQPLSTLSDGPVTTVYLFDEATGLPTDRLQTGGGRSEKVSQFEWRDGKGVERTTADANQDGRVDEALEADVKPRMSLLGLRALDAGTRKAHIIDGRMTEDFDGTRLGVHLQLTDMAAIGKGGHQLEYLMAGLQFAPQPGGLARHFEDTHYPVRTGYCEASCMELHIAGRAFQHLGGDLPALLDDLVGALFHQRAGQPRGTG